MGDAPVPVEAKDAADAVPNAVPPVEAEPVAEAAIEAPTPVEAAQAIETDVRETAEEVAEQASAAPVAVAETMEAVASPALESDVNPAVVASTAIQQGLTQMATTTPFSPTEAAEKTKAMFGDVQGRMTQAMEKSSKMGEELVEFSKGNVEAVIASARIAAKAGELIGQEAAEYGRKSFESATAMIKSMGTVKSPTELLQLQSEFARASFDSAVAEASKLSEMMMKVAGEISQPLSNRYALAAEKVKSATPTA